MNKHLNPCQWISLFCVLLIGLSTVLRPEIQAQVSETEEKEPVFDVQDVLPFDLRLVPELQEVDQAILEDNHYIQIQREFQSQNGPRLLLNEGQIQVNSISFYGVKGRSEYQDRPRQQNQEGLLLINVAISNYAEQNLYIPNNFIGLEDDNPAEKATDKSVYPLEFGYLEAILDNTKRVIEPEQTIEGYLMFQLSARQYFTGMRQGYLELVLKSWQNEFKPLQSETNGLASPEGNYSLVLPLNQTIAERILETQQFIQDLPSQEWWGDKQLVSRLQGPENLQQGSVNLQLNKMELCDLKLRPEYRQLFQQFPQGQLLLSVDLLLENKADSIYLLEPQDLTLTLDLAGRQFMTEDSLVKNVLPKYIGPRDQQKIQKVFVIDKAFYLQNAQGKALTLKVYLPTSGYGRLPNLHRLVKPLTSAYIYDVYWSQLTLANQLSFQGNYTWQVKADILFDEHLKMIHDK
ncbi:hypothetical protein WJ437_06110 [Ignavigranum ruoffiae]|uniref:hypothetical protein n=1 Tax=Ignavigranum ruoffiae TaxID=89093 RepID=UPI003B0012D7